MEQIKAYNKKGLNLNVVITTVSLLEILDLAEALNRERAEKGVRGPLYGIPLLVKVSVANLFDSLLL